MPLRFTGDWDRTRRWLKRVRREGVKSAAEHSSKLARTTYKRLIDHVHDQDLDWAPLAPSTQRKKHGDYAWVEGGALVESIQIQVESSTATRVTNVIGPTGQHPTAGRSNQELAGLLEEGSQDGTIPARPLFGPTFEEVRVLATDAAEAMLRELTEDL